MNPSNDEPQPPLLYDVVVPGEQVRANDGPWLRPEADGDAPGEQPQPPFAEAAAAPAASEPSTAHDAAQVPPAGAASPLTAAQRADIERHATRELARHLRSELERRLPDALREAEAPIRKAVDDALIDAVAASRRQQPPEEPSGGSGGTTPGADDSEYPNTNQPAPNR